MSSPSAFATPAAARLLRTPSRAARCAIRRTVPYMASRSRSPHKQVPDIAQPPPSPPSVPTAPEIAAISPIVCDFMNKEHVRHIASYIVNFGRNFDDLSQLTAVKMTALDAAGFTADVVSCDESDCVCVQERLTWPLGLCHNAADVISALKHLSTLCGLPADF